MTADGSVYDDLQGFGLGARHAVVAAHEEAQDLGHDRVGTEHLLLGLLADDELAPVVQETGAALPAARRKVLEAVPKPADGSRLVPLPRTPRCARAIGRAPRFARAAGAELVGSDHLLLAVLDVEGTAGQVLRGLGVDVEHLRSALGGRSDRHHVAAGADRTGPPASPAPRCPRCEADLGGVTATPLPATGATTGTVEAISCPTCGAVLGILPG